MLSASHAISDQGSVNVLMDQLLYDIASIEESGRVDKKGGSDRGGNHQIISTRLLFRLRNSVKLST